MSKFLKLFSVLGILLLSLFINGCSTSRNCKITYSIKEKNSNILVDKMVVGKSYYLYVTYSVDSKNQNDFKFVSFINANDNILVSYEEGTSSSFIIVGNSLEVTYEGKTGNHQFEAVYEITTKSAGESYIKFKNCENIFFSPTQIYLLVEEEK